VNKTLRVNKIKEAKREKYLFENEANSLSQTEGRLKLEQGELIKKYSALQEDIKRLEE
jgi:hypothetical protein